MLNNMNNRKNNPLFLLALSFGCLFPPCALAQNKMTAKQATIVGNYYHEPCGITITVSQANWPEPSEQPDKSNKYEYRYQSPERILTGKARVTDDAVVLADLEYSEDYFDAAVPDEQPELIKKYAKLKKAGERHRGIDLIRNEHNTLSLQNYGNAMNYYVKLGECDEKFLDFSKLEKRSDISKQLPKNWKIISATMGDLNKDKRHDIVLIVEENNPRKRLKNTGMGDSTLNINQRGIMVFFQRHDGRFELVEKNLTGFIPSENDEDSPCLADPLMYEGSIEIKKNILIVHFNYWLSCGSWYVTDYTYKFRYQNKRFALIGLDESTFHRASGEITETSTNYLTKKQIVTTGLNQFEKSNPTTEKFTIKIKKLSSLSKMTKNRE